MFKTNNSTLIHPGSLNYLYVRTNVILTKTVWTETSSYQQPFNNSDRNKNKSKELVECHTPIVWLAGSPDHLK